MIVKDVFAQNERASKWLIDNLQQRTKTRMLNLAV